MSEYENSLLGGKVRLLQKLDGYRTAIDPILLAASVPAKAGEMVLDLGCGVGAVSLCLHARVSGLTVLGLDVQKPLVDLARRNSALNNCCDDVRFLDGDLLTPPADIPSGRFDHVMANPPYLAANSGNPSSNAAKALANVEGKAVLVDWVRAAHRALKPGGNITFIYRADRIEHLLVALHGGFGELVIFPLWPARGKDAKRVIVAARKGVASPARISPGLALHNDDGSFSGKAQGILNNAEALSIS